MIKMQQDHPDESFDPDLNNIAHHPDFAMLSPEKCD